MCPYRVSPEICWEVREKVKVVKVGIVNRVLPDGTVTGGFLEQDNV